MLNPLSIPAGLASIAAQIPAALSALGRATEVLERGLGELERLNEQGEKVYDELVLAREIAGELNRNGTGVLEELREARGSADKLLEASERILLAGDRMLAAADEATAAIVRAQPTAEGLVRSAEPMLESSRQAQAELARATEELARANAQVARIIELAGPLETISDRFEKMRAPFSRDRES